MLSVIYAKCRKWSLNADCHYAEWHYAECRGATGISSTDTLSYITCVQADSTGIPPDTKVNKAEELAYL